MILDHDTADIVEDERAIVPLSRVETFLATRPPIDAAKEMRDKLVALCAYYSHKVDEYNQVYEGRLRTERYIGRLLADMPDAKTGPKELGNIVLPNSIPTLADIGFSKMQSSRLQELAEIPDQVFDDYVQQRKELGQRIVKSDLLSDAPLPFDGDEDRGSAMKPKINRAGDTEEASGYDSCQTPGYAIDPLLPYLSADWRIWEPACGENMLVEALYDAGYKEDRVIGSDVLTGDNFFHFEPDAWDCLITNPPYSIKYQWLRRCYELGKPFALLMPVETIGAKAAQTLMEEYGIQVIFLNRRVNFKMPNKGFDGGGAQFPVAWFTWGLNLETQIVFGRLP
jgi:hypothetical protein